MAHVQCENPASQRRGFHLAVQYSLPSIVTITPSARASSVHTILKELALQLSYPCYTILMTEPLEPTVAIACRVRASQAAKLAAEGMTSQVLKRIVAEYTGIPNQPKGKSTGRPKGSKSRK